MTTSVEKKPKLPVCMLMTRKLLWFCLACRGKKKYDGTRERKKIKCLHIFVQNFRPSEANQER